MHKLKLLDLESCDLAGGTFDLCIYINKIKPHTAYVRYLCVLFEDYVCRAGSLPPAWSNLSSLSILSLGQNSLTG